MNSIDTNKSESFECWQRRMQFACKRGNLESELLLIAFINSEQAQHLSHEQRACFESLLDIDDTTLMMNLLNTLPESKEESPYLNALLACQFELCRKIQKAYLHR